MVKRTEAAQPTGAIGRRVSMLKPEVISPERTNRTAQADPRLARESSERTRAGADNAGAAARFQQWMRRPTNTPFGAPRSPTRHETTPTTAMGDVHPALSTAGVPRSVAPEDQERQAHDDGARARESELRSECDLTPMSIGVGPGAPFVFLHGPVSSASTASVGAHVDELFAQLVMRAAVGGDAKRASMRLELGGRVVGRGHLTVHAEGDDVEIEIAAPPGVDAAALETRVTERLAAKGVKVTRFDVR